MRIVNLIAVITSMSFASSIFADTISTTNSQDCAKLKGSTSPFILVLKKGEELATAINQCAHDAKLSGATITGIGALENPTLNYYNLKNKKYQDRVFKGLYELISVSGNITQVNGKPQAHMHVAISNDRFHVLGGHISKAIVGVTAEITVHPLIGNVIKKVDPETGLELISTKA